MNKLLALVADPSRLASLPAAVLPRPPSGISKGHQGLPRVVGSRPSRMVPSGRPSSPVEDFQGSSGTSPPSGTSKGRRRRLASLAATPRSSIYVFMSGP